MSGAKLEEQQPTATKLYFPEGSLLNQLEIAVIAAERKKSEYLKDPFIAYFVDSRPVEHAIVFDPGCGVWRRYSEFELLRNYLMAMYPYIVIPPLPEKRVNFGKGQITVDKFNPNFIERRRQGLECFLLRLAAHPTFSQDSLFRGFFNQEIGWKEDVATSKWKLKVDNRLKTLNASMALKKPDARFERIRGVCDTLNTNITASLKLQLRISHKRSSAMKQHLEFGRVLKEWSAIENKMGPSLYQAGHEIEKLAFQTKAILNEEEIGYIDQLKEYLSFTDSLWAVVRKQNVMAWNLEKAEETLSLKSRQREQLIWDIQILGTGEELHPPTSLKSLQSVIFGVDTLEVKQKKLVTIEEQINEAGSAVTAAEEDLNVFIDKSLKDYERFTKQKIRDVSEVMENYIKTQITVNKLGLLQWQTMMEYFMTM